MKPRSVGPVMLLIGLFILFGSLAALAHGEQGKRVIFTYDFQPVIQRPVDLFSMSDEYRAQLTVMGEQGDNDCITVSYLPARLPWDKSQLVPAPTAAGGSVGVSDYLITGRFFSEAWGESVSDTFELSLVTTRSRTLVAKGVGHLAYDLHPSRMAAERMGARFTAMNLAGNDKGTEHLADKILKYEQKVREEKTETAIGPQLSLEGFTDTMRPGASQKITVRLEDCDGYRLKGRTVAVIADEGTVSPEEVTIGEDGTAEVTYTAPGKRVEVSLSAVFQYERPSEKKDVATAGSWIDVKDDKPDDPAIFHVSLEVEQEYRIAATAGPGTPMPFQWTEAMDPLKLEFDVNQRLEPIQETFKGEWAWRAKYSQHDGVFSGEDKGESHGTEFERWEVTLSRHLKPVKDEPKLEVVDDPLAKSLAPILGYVQTDQPLDTLRVHYEVLPAGGEMEAQFDITFDKWKIRDEHTSPTLIGWGDLRDLKYDYKQPTNEVQQDENPDRLRTPVFDVTKDRIRYRMTLKDVKFDYLPGEGMSVKVGGEDYTGKFKYVLFWREWRAATKYTTLGSPRTGPYRVSRDWTEGADDLSSEMLDPLGWIVDVSTVPKEEWPAVRVLREYLIAVEGFPEFGYMYAAVTAETEPTGFYWVRKYLPEKIEADDWEKIKKTRAPYRDEDSGGKPVRSFRR